MIAVKDDYGQLTGLGKFETLLYGRLNLEKYLQVPELPDFPLSRTVSSPLKGVQLRRKIREKDEDVVFLPNQKALTFDPRKVDSEVVVYVHDILPRTSCFKAYGNESFLDRVRGYPSAFDSTRYVKMLAHVDHVVAASEFTKKEVELRTGYGGEVDVVYQGVDNLPSLEPGVRDIDVLFVGSSVDRKNPEFVEKAFHRLQEEGFKVRAVTGMDLPGKVEGRISDREVADLYNRSRFILHPSFMEGFGRTPVEAQRYGCVPLALDREINHEVLGKEGMAWMPIQSVDDVVRYALNGVSSDNRKAARCNASRFQWWKTEEELKEVLSKV